MGFNPFGAGLGLSTYSLATTPASTNVSIPLEQGGVFRRKMGIKSSTDMRFQSLWSRAGSFDAYEVYGCKYDYVSIPLEQGGVFRLRYRLIPNLSSWFQSLWNRAGSFDRGCALSPWTASGFNPFRAGRGLSTTACLKTSFSRRSFNPFRAGRGLSTYSLATTPASTNVSIPLEQGEVFRLCIFFHKTTLLERFNPFGTGRGLSTHL